MSITGSLLKIIIVIGGPSGFFSSGEGVLLQPCIILERTRRVFTSIDYLSRRAA
jgi:hypothetical protein